ncbi:cobaltochelatase subunit CobN [Polaromonas sp. SM01]|uniref:cobaltochelatase subunit CobN n=1 Tax=Polaromonas sp. SM01 TaxID=3085630 RepID=UPI002981AF63|nr:cobaltochelatase subunit CobN [Polaromonas sp. SM01]MDW5444798.1 cobaltochelatase subunit CobN [Polaromonas sp. SM01]
MSWLLRVFLWLAASMGLAAAQPAQSPIVLLSTYVVTPPRLAQLVAVAQQAGVPLTVVSAEQDTPQGLEQALRGARLLVIDAPHSSVANNTAAKFGELLGKISTPYVLVGEFSTVAINQSSAAAPLAAERGVSAAWAQRLREYWRFGGVANIGLAMAALKPGASFADSAALPPAVQLPLAGFYHPRWPQVENQAAALDKLPVYASNVPPAQEGRAQAAPKTIAIAVNNAVFTGSDTAWLDTLIAALEQRGLRAYAFYGPRQQKDLFFQATHIAGPSGQRRVADLIINAALVFNPTERKAELERIGVPVLQTMPALAMNPAEWAQSKDGLALGDVSYYYTPSELSGMVDAMLITARDSTSGSLLPIAGQINAVADKAAAMTRLQQTPPAQRRVAMMVYNYPLGEGNVGASFLNVPKSLHNMLAAMKTAGYQTEAPTAEQITPQVLATMAAFYKPEVVQGLQAQGLADVLPLPRYLDWFRSLPPATQKRIEDYWGPADKAAMVRPSGVAGQTGQLEPAFVIPRLQLGHVVILPQPLRHEITAANSAEMRKKRIGHRSQVPLSHNYLATYLWLRTQLGAHALVHVGTHGTVEWAPGKERGLSAQDDPLLALGDVPNVYPYIMDNLGEALTAKRRGRAVLVSHSTPMFSPAGFRPQVHEMHDLMHDWETVAPGPVKAELEARLLAHFVEQQFHRDLKWSQEKIRADFSGFMEVLHPFLDDLAQTAQPLGLAAFGEVPDANRRLLTVLQTLRKPLIDAMGEDIDEVFLLDGARLMQSRPARWLQVALKDPQAASRLDLRAEDTKMPKTSVPNRAEAKLLDPQVLLALAQRAVQLEAALANNEEISGFLKALDGQHLATSYGGDPVRNPESLPTGRNLYGFDPSRVPTRQAWDTGVAAFDAWMLQHRNDNKGQWPEKIAFTLWAGETMRHQGVMESQALHALGLRPRWDEAGRVVGLDTVPADTLKRPRLDVLLSVTGSYRDQFPTVMRWLDEGVQQVAALREKDNFVARNAQAIAKTMVAGGASAAQAQRWSTARVFSNEQGTYGTGLSDAAQNTDLWKTAGKGGGDAEMSSLYMARMGHAYGDKLGELPAHAGQAQVLEKMRSGAYASNLAQVDAALLSRTSNTYGMLSSDDPFQYLGGIAQAVRQLTGKDPALYVQNLRDNSEVKTDSAASALTKEMHTRYLHPQWINAQKAEGYSGTLQVLKTAQFLWGWQVTAPQTVRQDHWQSLHNVYVRDQYKLGTREWLEGDNRAAFAQTLERMLDAVRLNYWQPDDATKKELVQAYQEALKATGLRESNPAVQRFAAAQAQAAKPAAPSQASPAQAAPQPAQPAQPVDTSADDAAPAPVRGLTLKPQTDEPVTPPAMQVANSLAALLGAALLIALGAWRQSRRARPRVAQAH